MEFACGFVYVPPSPGQRDGGRSPANVTGFSALLPPAKLLRPRSPPPPPPTNPEKSPNSVSKIIEQLENGKDTKKVTKPAPFYQNGDFLKKLQDSSSISVTPQPTPPPRRSAPVPDLPPRPAFMRLMPEYVMVLPSSPSSPSPSSSQKSSTGQPPVTSTEKVDKGPLLGNPNVVLVSLGKLLSDEKMDATAGEPCCCSRCGSVLDTFHNNQFNVCYFCQSSDSKSSPVVQEGQTKGSRDGLFLLNPRDKPTSATNAMLIFCIDISGSMSITSQVSEGDHISYGSRLQFVQEAVIQCVQRLSQQQPGIRVGLISFNFQVTMHGYKDVPSRVLRDAELIESSYLKKAAATFPTPPPLSQTRDYLKRQVTELCASGTTALGPAALLAIEVASRQSGSKVIICTDGKANTALGNLEVQDNDARTLLSSTIFYEELGEYAANQGVTVSVLSIEGTDCRLDELGRLADRTRGTVVIASPDRLHPEFEQIIENRTIATQCTVTLLLPKSLRVRGEREAGHKASRAVGNVDPDTEITFQFGAHAPDARAPALAAGSRVSIQLQLRYKKRNGQRMLRVFTAEREVTDDSAAALSSLSVAIVQLNSAQASAALAVRGRLLDARGEGELQRKLIERALEHNRNAEDKETYQEWVKTMEPIYNNIQNFTRRKAGVSDAQRPLSDAAAALLYAMKHSNRKSMKNKHSL